MKAAPKICSRWTCITDLPGWPGSRATWSRAFARRTLYWNTLFISPRATSGTSHPTPQSSPSVTTAVFRSHCRIKSSAGGQYRVDHAFFEFLQIYTNTVPGGYYRSPGAVATAFAVDSHTDMIARELKMDPGEFRLKNFLGEGEEDAVGHRLHHVRFRE